MVLDRLALLVREAPHLDHLDGGLDGNDLEPVLVIVEAKPA